MTALTAIADEISTCTKCALHTGRTNTVPGAGDPNADILFIGEGPGFHEDKQGLPFVGRSGDYLNYLLEKIGLNREEVFITNVVKCRPPNNRDPLPDEIVACKAYLDRQIALIDPLVIATLGRFSMARYFPNARISQIHGQPRYDERRAYFPLYHPAAALRNPKLRHDMEADFRHLLEVMHEMRDKRNAATESPPIEAEHDDPEEPPQQLKLF
ncbi:MAG: uracil-DNA glycosylase [Chloroflexi bacterium]|nr:MAG: uracil-DNA glycosylase [Phototrophicales bacterium]RMF81263.1 MAG: uracil-DNA glycosylase [Chloroflexota bacterium]